MDTISISKFTFEHYPDGFGIGHSAPRLSWRYSGTARDWRQIAVELKISVNGASSQILRIETSQSVLVPWPVEPLKSRDIATVSVRAIGEALSTPWSNPAVAEVALLDRSDWKASLIKAEIPQAINATKRPVVFRKDFTLADIIHRSRLYITAHGVYEAKINGTRVGDHVLAPGWTSYNHRLNYQTYDVTDLLRPGPNTLVVEVGEGWYAGRLGFMGGVRSIYGEQIGILAQLENGGSSILAATDASWKCGSGTILSSEIYDGEVVDLCEEVTIQNAVRVETLDQSIILAAPEIPPVRRTQEIEPVEISRSPSGKVIVDFGQNLVGWVRIDLQAFGADFKGKVIKLSHAEVLEKGECAFRPLRLAKAQDTLTLSDLHSERYWEPKFTFHGFRYVQVDDWPNEMPKKQELMAMAIHTEMEQTGWFECSDSMVNKLHENIRWGMRGNFVSVPTDCPQRDERMGWTGDLAIFAPTANFLYDTHGMLSNWMADLAAEQFEQEDALPPPVVPDVMQFAGKRQPLAVWSDVTVTAPWDIYQGFGDISILKEQYQSMTAWVDRAIPRGTNRLWDKTIHQLGDWLDPSAPPQDPGKAQTDSQLVANAYLIHITGLLAKISHIIGHEERGLIYLEDYSHLKTVFQDEYITPNGRLSSDSQTAYSLVICFDLCANKRQLEGAADRLEFLVRSNGFKVATGFVGTPLICKALSLTGRHFLAYRMLLEKKAPSWLYAITMGSTSIWERWDSMLPDGSLNPGDMLSFNHYAFGAIAQFLHETVGGISPLQPGWKKTLVRPVPGGILTSASVRHLSSYGMIESRWKIVKTPLGENFQLEVVIPPNTNACVVLPGQKEDEGIEVGSGQHDFIIRYVSDERWPPRPIHPPPPFYHPEPDEFCGN